MIDEEFLDELARFVEPVMRLIRPAIESARSLTQWIDTAQLEATLRLLEDRDYDGEALDARAAFHDEQRRRS